MEKLGSDWLYIALGAGALYLIGGSGKSLIGAVSSLGNVVSNSANLANSTINTGSKIINSPEAYSVGKFIWDTSPPGMAVNAWNNRPEWLR
jgi:hypothetical protein